MKYEKRDIEIILSKYIILPNKTDDNSNLTNYGLNEYKLPYILLELEKKYNIRVSDEDIDVSLFISINKIIDYLLKNSITNN